MVSTQMVDKLSISTYKHTQPYSLTWLKKNDICIDKSCFVEELSTEDKLREQLWCDIISMDTYHIS